MVEVPCASGLGGLLQRLLKDASDSDVDPEVEAQTVPREAVSFWSAPLVTQLVARVSHRLQREHGAEGPSSSTPASAQAGADSLASTYRSSAEYDEMLQLWERTLRQELQAAAESHAAQQDAYDSDRLVPAPEASDASGASFGGAYTPVAELLEALHASVGGRAAVLSRFVDAGAAVELLEGSPQGLVEGARALAGCLSDREPQARELAAAALRPLLRACEHSFSDGAAVFRVLAQNVAAENDVSDEHAGLLCDCLRGLPTLMSGVATAQLRDVAAAVSDVLEAALATAAREGAACDATTPLTRTLLRSDPQMTAWAQMLAMPHAAAALAPAAQLSGLTDSALAICQQAADLAHASLAGVPAASEPACASRSPNSETLAAARVQAAGGVVLALLATSAGRQSFEPAAGDADDRTHSREASEAQRAHWQPGKGGVARATAVMLSLLAGGACCPAGAEHLRRRLGAAIAASPVILPRDLGARCASALRRHEAATRESEAQGAAAQAEHSVGSARNHSSLEAGVRFWAAVVVSVAQSELGCRILLVPADVHIFNPSPAEEQPISTESVLSGAPTHFDTALATWLSSMAAHEHWRRPEVQDWLGALAALAARPRTSAALGASIASAAKLIARASHSAGWRAGQALDADLAAVCLAGLQMCRCPLAAAAVADTPAALAPVAAAAVAELAAAASAAVDKEVTRAAAQGARAALRSRAAAWRRAEAVLEGAALLGCTAAGQRALVDAGLDAALVGALLRAPEGRLPADDGAPLSAAMERVVRLLQARMRWPSAAALLSELGQAASLDAPASALLALLRLLHRGAAANARLTAIAAYEDERLLLACLVQPWLGDAASEGVLTSLLGTERPIALLLPAALRALGRPTSVDPQLPGQDPAAAEGSRDGAREGDDLSTVPREFASLPSALRWAVDVDMRRSSADARSPLDDAGSAPEPSTPGARASAVSAVIYVDPGMRDVVPWWRAAASALESDVARDPTRARRQDLALLLQRVVLVAMPRVQDGAPSLLRPGESPDDDEADDEAGDGSFDAGCMQRLSGSGRPPWPAVAVPPVSTVSDAEAAPWLARCFAEGRSDAAAASGLARLQAACAAALTRQGGPVDWFAVVVHDVMGASDRTSEFLTAYAATPGAPYVWPLLGRQMRGSRPRMELLLYVQAVMAEALPRVAAASRRCPGVVACVASAWLDTLFAHVLPGDACCELLGVAVCQGPGMLVSCAVALLAARQADVVEHCLAGDLGAWMHGWTVADFDARHVLAHAVAVFAAHRHSLQRILI